MNRQFLKNLELDGEIIEKIMDEHGSTTNNLKDQLAEKKDEVKSIKSERDSLKDKVAGVEDAEDKINSLQSKYDEATKQLEDYKSKIDNNKLDTQIIKNVPDAHDIDDVLNVIDRNAFEYDDDGQITNFDDVLTSVREKKPHYFNGDVKTGTTEGEGGDNTGDASEQQPPQPAGIEYSTGKGQGAGSTGSNDFQAIGEKWANVLNGGSNNG